MITKILRNIFISVGLLFTVGQLLAGGMSDGVLHLGDMSLGARPPTYTNVDPPGSVFTFPQCINPAGVIAGEYAYADFVPHGFVRARDGIISTFDNPAGAFPIVPLSINPPGMIAGVYWMPATSFTVSCALRRVRSPRLTHQARAQVLSKARKARTSTRQG